MCIITKAKKGVIFTVSLMVLLLITGKVWAAGIGLSNAPDPDSPNTYVIGDTINYKMEVSNPSEHDITIDVFEYYPDGTSELLDSQLTLPPGGLKNFTTNYVVKASDVDPDTKEVVNTLGVEGFDSTGDEINANISAISTIVFPSISVDIDAPTYGVSGETVTYHYTIKNTGDVDLSLQSVVDSLFGDIGDQYSTILSPGQEETVTFTKSIDSTDLSSISNNVQVIYQVEGTTYTHTVEASDEHVMNINNRPIAVDLNEQTPENTPVTVNVLDKSSDVDGDKLVVSEVTPGANGQVVINDDGTITYTPNTNFNGTDTFTYTISDGKGGTATAKVTVVVDPVANEYGIQWETAWGGWQTSKGFEKFNKKSNPAGALVVDNVTRSGSSAWSMAIIFDGTEKTVDLVRGQYGIVGSVTVKADGKGNLVVSYNVAKGYVLGDIHCGAYAKLSMLNVGNGKLNGNDKINGNTVTIPYTGGTVYVGAHCEVGKLVPIAP